MAEIAGLYMINDSDSEELKRKKINSNFNAILSGLTNGLGNGSTGVQIVFGGNGLAGSSHGYYNAVRDRLEVDRLFAEDMEAKYLRTDFLNVENGATIAGVKIGDGCVIADKVSASKGWVGNLLVQDNLISSKSDVFYLEAIKVNADSITAGTLVADRIFTKEETRDDDGKVVAVTYYPVMGDGTKKGDNGYEGIKVNTDYMIGDGSLNGEKIVDNTLDGKKIVAESILVDQITTNNLMGTNGWINLHTGEFCYGLNEDGEKFSWATPEREENSERNNPEDELRPQLSMSVANHKMFTIIGGSTNTLRSVASNFVVIPEDKASEYLDGNAGTINGWAWIGKKDGSLALKKVTA